MTVTTRSFSAGQYVLHLDGAPDTAYIQSIQGGHVKGAVISEKHGADHNQIRHLGSVECEPISLELGMAVSKPWLQWIKASWNRDFSRKNGSIVYADFDRNARLQVEFFEALVTETSFPACDGSDKKAAYLGVKLDIEHSKMSKASGKITNVDGHNRQKNWLTSSFNFNIDDMDTSMVNKVDAFKVTQKVKKLYTGKDRFAQLEPSGIEFPNITFYMAAAYADDFIKWYDDFIVKGDKDTSQYKTGSIEYMAPNGADTLLQLDLYGIAISSISLEKAEAQSAKLARMKIECSVEMMDIIEGGPGLE
jgi:hypothetical protein